MPETNPYGTEKDLEQEFFRLHMLTEQLDETVEKHEMLKMVEDLRQKVYGRIWVYPLHSQAESAIKDSAQKAHADHQKKYMQWNFNRHLRNMVIFNALLKMTVIGPVFAS